MDYFLEVLVRAQCPPIRIVDCFNSPLKLFQDNFELHYVLSGTDILISATRSICLYAITNYLHYLRDF